MNRKSTMLLPLVSLIALASFAASPTSSERPAAVSLNDYRVLWERNIFVRNRTQPRVPRPPRTAATRPAVVVDADERLLLRGIAQSGRECVAFIEDTDSGKRITARVGDSAGGGKLLKITLDYVEYERDGSTARIEVGSSLAGTTPSQPTTGQAASGNSSADADKSDGATDAAAVIEQMRKRREQEDNR